MAGRLSKVARSLKPSPIQEISNLAQKCNAINLGEGFPDFPAPPQIKEAAIFAIQSDFNQYKHVEGICDHLEKRMKEKHGLSVDPLTDVAICCGQTEAFAAAVFATIDPGDEVLLFDPVFETYEACISMVGGIPIYVRLEPPNWTLDMEKFKKSFTARTKAVVLNSPHNPTGKVFGKVELEAIAEACCSMDCLAITDEVYEEIVYDMEEHLSLASFPGMQERTIITSSLSKTFSVTGWRIGWAIASASIASAIRNIHVKLTDSAPAPFQEAALTALESPPEYFESLRRDYMEKRDYIVKVLLGVGFQVQFKPQGSFFVFAELPEHCQLSDPPLDDCHWIAYNTYYLHETLVILHQIEFAEELIRKAGVASVPGCGFFRTKLPAMELSEVHRNYQNRYIRFAFCKSNATLDAAAQRMEEILDSKGCLKL